MHATAESARTLCEKLDRLGLFFDVRDLLSRPDMRKWTEDAQLNDLTFRIPVESILQALARSIEDRIDERIITKKQNIRVQYFAKKLTAHLCAEYGQPLAGVVAATASAVLDAEVTEDYVRHIAKC